MNAADIAVALGDARREGRGWRCRCPLHKGRSLTLRDGDDGCVLVTCWGGCDRRDVLSELRRRGLLDVRARGSSAKPSQREEAVRTDARRSKAALAIWQSATPAGGTLAQNYLFSRGLHLSLPPTVRFHAGLKHPAGDIWPVMVALVTRGVVLARDGQGKAPIEPAKMMFGPCRGGAVRLGPVGDRLMIAEGIETALSAMQATAQTAWAALSTSGLRTLELPADVHDVVVLADGDEPGEAAAHDAALRWKREGRRVRIAHPPRGFDFNDVLLSRTFCRVEDAA
jgi:putative DNA primase/helicase